MPLIKARTNRVRTVRHISRMHEPNRDTLMLYARFIGDTADYVLNQLIVSTIGKDRDFVEWRTAHASGAHPVSSERDRTTAARRDTDPQR
jgi:hypothetical protein